MADGGSCQPSDQKPDQRRFLSGAKLLSEDLTDQAIDGDGPPPAGQELVTELSRCLFYAA